MQWITIAAGVALVVVCLNDVFHTLFHPGGQGRLSARLVKLPWWISRRVRGRPGQMAGPIGIVLVVAVWVVLQAVGWALIYLPQIPDGFAYSPGVVPDRYPDFAEALYVSLVAFATLGFGDVVAISPVLRLLAPIEALIGFMLFTASVSWLMQLYPALARRRTLALRMTVLRRSRYHERLDPDDSSSATQLLELADQLAQIRIDLGQNAETYYFAEADHATCLAHAMRYGQELSRLARGSSAPSVAAAGAVLDEAVADLAMLIRQQFLPRIREETGAVIEAAQDDHGCRDRA